MVPDNSRQHGIERSRTLQCARLCACCLCCSLRRAGAEVGGPPPRSDEQQPKEQRTQSPILHLRNINNWTKSVLLNLYLRPGMAVFDMCCGKGGDLLKFASARVSYVFGADIADMSIQEARKRYAERRVPFAADFVAVDCCTVDLEQSGLFPAQRMFDLVSCQFAFHYCFESETKARMMLHNISMRLKPGGYFVGTLPNAYRLMKRLREAEGASFGNAVYQVHFDEKLTAPPPIFGYRYTFHLEDAIDDLPEYLTYFPAMCRLAGEYGLAPVLEMPFHEFFTQHRSQNEDLLDRMHVFNNEGTISDAEWEAAGEFTQKLTFPDFFFNL